MNVLRSLMVLGLVLTLAAPAEAAKKKKKKSGTLSGVVTAVEAGKETNKEGGGTFTIKTTEGKKKKKNVADAPAGAEKKITVNKDTKFEKVSGKKKARETKPATFEDLKTGANVSITLKNGAGDVAEKVQIDEGKKKKKKNS